MLKVRTVIEIVQNAKNARKKYHNVWSVFENVYNAEHRDIMKKYVGRRRQFCIDLRARL